MTVIVLTALVVLVVLLGIIVPRLLITVLRRVLRRVLVWHSAAWRGRRSSGVASVPLARGNPSRRYHGSTTGTTLGRPRVELRVKMCSEWVRAVT